MKITVEKIINALARMDAPWFKGDRNLTIVGIRAEGNATNTFNDKLCLLMQRGISTQLHIFDCTTDPGLYYLQNPLNVRGTAILKTGHYPKCWRIGKHKNKYKALVQNAPMSVYRDRDRDGKFDLANVDTGMFGINLHKAGRSSKLVGKWSAGCQVIAKANDFSRLMQLVEDSAEKYGNRFSYTLINEEDL